MAGLVRRGGEKQGEVVREAAWRGKAGTAGPIEGGHGVLRQGRHGVLEICPV